MDNTEPLVSVLMACYNHERYVEEALDSINNQDYSNIEIILIDDCSRDNSVNIIEDWLKKCRFPYTFIAHQTNKGLSNTCNELLSLAKGKYLNFFATDDIMLSHKISSQVAILEKLPSDYALCYGDCIRIDEEGNVEAMSLFLENTLVPSVVPSGNIFKHIAKHFFIYTQSALIRIASLKEINFEFNEKYIAEDWFIELILADKYKFVGVNEPFVKYRVVSDSITRQQWKSDNLHNIVLNHFHMFNDLKVKKSNQLTIEKKLLQIYYSYLLTSKANPKGLVEILKRVLSKRPFQIFNFWIWYRTTKFAFRYTLKR